MRIVGIETSCDETAIGVVEDGRAVLSNAVASSLALHAPYGGVIPEIAARLHVETIWTVLAQALAEAKVRPEDLDAIAVTQGPGLPGALLIGLAFAKGLSLALGRPLIPVDHLAAHLYAGQMTDPELGLPYVGLVVSGGHTILCVAHEDCRFEVLGETRDDAVGEAFDKVAKLLGLGYPGGPVIDRLATEGNPARAAFPRVSTKQPFDFSFSGLKTAVYHYVQKLTDGSRLKVQGSREVGRPIEPPRPTADESRDGPTSPARPSLQPPAPAGVTGGPGGRAGLRAEGDGPEPPPQGVGGPAADPPGLVAGRAQSPEPPGSLTHQQITDIAASFQEAAVDVLVAKTVRACQRTGIRRVVVGGGVASNSRLRARFAQVDPAHKLQVVFPPPRLCVDNGAMVAGIAYPLLQQGRVAPLSLASDPNLCLG